MVDFEEQFFEGFNFEKGEYFKLPSTSRNNEYQARVDAKTAQYSRWFRDFLERKEMTYTELNFAIVYSVRKVNIVDGVQCCVCKESTPMLLVAEKCFKGHHVHYNCAKFLRQRINCQPCLNAAENLPELFEQLKVCEEDEADQGMLEVPEGQMTTHDLKGSYLCKRPRPPSSKSFSLSQSFDQAHAKRPTTQLQCHRESPMEAPLASSFSARRSRGESAPDQ